MSTESLEAAYQPIHRKKASSRALVELYLSRIDEHDSKLHAFVSVYEGAR